MAQNNSNRVEVTNAALRSLVWIGLSLWWAMLVRPEGSSFRTIRGGFSRCVGLALVVAGFTLHTWATIALARGIRSAYNAPRSLIVTGPYRYVRNPIYLAVMVIFAGIYTVYASWRVSTLLFAVGTAVAVHFFVMWVEEPATHKRFGSQYDDYRRKVPRWLPLATQ